MTWISLVPVSAQLFDKKEDPLYVYLRGQADSTLILRYTGGWNSGTPHFTILAKKGDSISFCEYVGYLGLGNREITNSPVIQKKFRKLRWVLITKVTPKMKEYFAVYPVGGAAKSILWKGILSADPWGIADDKVEGYGCPVNKDKNYPIIHDADGHNLTLITKNEIRGLDFYAPGFYEKHCPGRKGRVAMVKIVTLFTTQTK